MQIECQRGLPNKASKKAKMIQTMKISTKIQTQLLHSQEICYNSKKITMIKKLFTNGNSIIPPSWNINKHFDIIRTGALEWDWTFNFSNCFEKEKMKKRKEEEQKKEEESYERQKEYNKRKTNLKNLTMRNPTKRAKPAMKVHHQNPK